MIGVFLCLLQRQRGEPVEFGTLFKGFDQFVQGLVVAALKMIPIIIVLVPYYWRAYGPTNFLYFCDVALFLTLGAVWLESPLLATTIYLTSSRGGVARWKTCMAAVIR